MSASRITNPTDESRMETYTLVAEGYSARERVNAEKWFDDSNRNVSSNGNVSFVDSESAELR